MSGLPILNIKQFDFKIDEGDFYSNDFSTHLSTYHASITKPHKHDFYLVVLFTHGEGIHEVDFNSFPIKRGALFLLSPGQTHHWEFTEEAKGYIFFHSKEFYNLSFPNKNIDDYPFFYSSYNSPFLLLEEENIAYYESHLKAIYKEFYASEFMRHRKFALMVDLLYIDISRLYANFKQKDIDRITKGGIWFRKLEELIELWYFEKKKPSQYAEALNISVKHLNKIVINTVGYTTSDLIHQRILLEAKRLLTHGELTVQEIAFELGYEDTSYFSRFFKKKCGESPLIFSKKYKNQ